MLSEVVLLPLCKSEMRFCSLFFVLFRVAEEGKTGKDITPAVCVGLLDKAMPLIVAAFGEAGLDIARFEVVDVILARLLPGAEVFAHMDANYGTPQYQFWQGIYRMHLPLVTNERVEFCVAGRDYLDREAFVDAKGFAADDVLNLKRDTVYQVNNLRFHAVANKSDTLRDHLIVDLRDRT